MNALPTYEKVLRQALEPIEADLLAQELTKYPYFPLLRLAAARHALRATPDKAEPLVAMASLYQHDRPRLAQQLNGQVPLDIAAFTESYRSPTT